ncbi:hypothetical protein OIU76_000663, partial [Salix suchowensis]
MKEFLFLSYFNFDQFEKVQ